MAARSAQVGRRRGPGLPGAFSGRRLRAAARGGQARPGLGLPRHGTCAGCPRHSRQGPWPSALGPGPRPPSFRMPLDPSGLLPRPFRAPPPPSRPLSRGLPPPPAVTPAHPYHRPSELLLDPSGLPQPPPRRPAPQGAPPPRRPRTPALPLSGSFRTPPICRPLAIPSLPSLRILSLGPDLPPAPRLGASEPYPSLPTPQDPSPSLCKSGFPPTGLPSACWPISHPQQPHAQGHRKKSLFRLLPAHSSSSTHTPEPDSS